MTREERAKQFAPFDSMKGLKEALLAQEIRHNRKPEAELCEDYAEQLDRMLHRIQPGTAVRIRYVKGGEEIERTGTVRKVDAEQGILTLDAESVPIPTLTGVRKV